MAPDSERPEGPCAWCLAERNQAPEPDSHGICARHTAMLLATLQPQRAEETRRP
jgi:hypothetical protein